MTVLFMVGVVKALRLNSHKDQGFPMPNSCENKSPGLNFAGTKGAVCIEQ
jgi:hypothetical protein